MNKIEQLVENNEILNQKVEILQSKPSFKSKKLKLKALETIKEVIPAPETKVKKSVEIYEQKIKFKPTLETIEEEPSLQPIPIPSDNWFIDEKKKTEMVKSAFKKLKRDIN